MANKDSRKARIADIRARLQEGTYRVSSEQIAESLMKRMTERVSAKSKPHLDDLPLETGRKDV